MNVAALMETLSRILSKKHNAKIRITATKKKD